MAYDEELAHRIRAAIGAEHPVTETPMFGGLAFMLRGNIAVALTSKGELLVRLGVEGAEAALARPHARVAEMGSRRMRGWVFIEPGGVRAMRDLRAWVRRGLDFADGLAPKG